MQAYDPTCPSYVAYAEPTYPSYPLPPHPTQKIWVPKKDLKYKEIKIRGFICTIEQVDNGKYEISVYVPKDHYDYYLMPAIIHHLMVSRMEKDGVYTLKKKFSTYTEAYKNCKKWANFFHYRRDL